MSTLPPPARSLTTERLLLHPLALADAEPIQDLFPRWEIVRFLSAVVPWPYPPNGALTFIRDIALPAMARGEEWHWSLRLRSDPGPLIGVISLMTQQDNNRGFWLGLPWQGRGYMGEAVEAVTGFWFQDLGRDVLRVPKAVSNEASRRISLRSGMRVIRTEERDYVSGRQQTEIWEMTRSEWVARRTIGKSQSRSEE